MSHLEKFSSIEAILEQLESNRYIADQLLATVIYLVRCDNQARRPIRRGAGRQHYPILPPAKRKRNIRFACLRFGCYPWFRIHRYIQFKIISWVAPAEFCPPQRGSIPV